MARPLSQEARRKAVEAAQQLIATRGIGGCTLEAVAKKSGVAKTTLYRHWSSRNMLLVHAIDCQIERIPTPNTGSLRSDLLTLMAVFQEVANTAEHRRLMLEVMATAATDPELAAVHRSLMQERRRPLCEVVERAIERGEIDPVDPQLAADFIEGPMVAKMIKLGEPVDGADLDTMIDFTVRGLGGTPNPTTPATPRTNGGAAAVSAPTSEPTTAAP